MTPNPMTSRRPWTIRGAAARARRASGSGWRPRRRTPPVPGRPRPRQPSCLPWQAPTSVPAGGDADPRVFPTDEPSSATVATGSSAPGATSPPAARPATPPARVICRNAPPTPFARPAWLPESVVGGARLASDGVIVDAARRGARPAAGLRRVLRRRRPRHGEILAAKSPHAWLRPASTLKTLTALTLHAPARPAPGRRRRARTPRRRPARASASSPATATRSAASSTRC